jgi:hypothetical protein
MLSQITHRDFFIINAAKIAHLLSLEYYEYVKSLNAKPLAETPSDVQDYLNAYSSLVRKN